jgi:5-formyltetrahydrofolate cyclo-ligase
LDKAQLRQKMLHERSQMTAETRRAASRKMWDQLYATALWEHCEVLHAFLPQLREPDTLALVSQALAQEKKVITSVVVGNGVLEHVWLEDVHSTRLNRWQIPEVEPHKRRPADPAEAQLLLVPGLAFDRSGNRVGFGGGFYDRFLSSVPHIPRLGVCFQYQWLEQIPAEDHDIPMHGILTEQTLHWVGSHPLSPRK